MGDSSCYKLMLHYVHRHEIKTVYFQYFSLQLTREWLLFTAVRTPAEHLFILHQRANLKALKAKRMKS